jgi:hypothetical protein
VLEKDDARGGVIAARGDTEGNDWRGNVGATGGRRGSTAKPLREERLCGETCKAICETDEGRVACCVTVESSEDLDAVDDEAAVLSYTSHNNITHSSVRTNSRVKLNYRIASRSSWDFFGQYICKTYTVVGFREAQNCV